MIFHIDPPKKKFPGKNCKLRDPETQTYLRVLHSQGVPQREIGMLLGTSTGTISDYCLRNGLKRERIKYSTPSDTESKIVELTSQKLAQHEIADALGISVTTVGRTQRRLGLQSAHPRKRAVSIPDGEFANIRALWESGKTQAQIADIYDCRQTAVSRYMNMHGLLLMNRKRRPNQTNVAEVLPMPEGYPEDFDQFSAFRI